MKQGLAGGGLGRVRSARIRCEGRRVRTEHAAALGTASHLVEDHHVLALHDLMHAAGHNSLQVNTPACGCTVKLLARSSCFLFDCDRYDMELTPSNAPQKRPSI